LRIVKFENSNISSTDSIDKKTKVKPKAKKSENIEETVEEYQVAVYDIFDEE